MKRPFIILLFFFLPLTFLTAGYIDAITDISTVYGVFSDHYEGATIIANSNTNPSSDAVYLFADNSVLKPIIDEERFEGDSILAFITTFGGGETKAYYSLAYNNSSKGIMNRAKDLSDYKYMMFSYRLNENEAEQDEFFGNYFYVGLASENLLSERSYQPFLLRKNYEDSLDPTEIITSEGAELDQWNTIVISTTDFIYLQYGTDHRDRDGEDLDFSAITSFHITARGGNLYADNWVFFEEIPSEILFSTTNPITHTSSSLLISVDAVTSGGDLSVMPLPAWNIISGPSDHSAQCDTNAYSAYFRADKVGTYIVEVSTGIWDSERGNGANSTDTLKGEWVNLQNQITITVEDFPDMNSEFKIYSEFVNKGELNYATQDLEYGTSTGNTISVSSIPELDGPDNGGGASLDMDCTLTALSNWAGFYITESPRDLSTFASVSTSFLRFYIKTDVDVEISIKSEGMSDSHNAKISLSEIYINPDINSWQLIMIPLQDFKSRDATLDFSKIMIPFSLNVVGEIGSHNVMVNNIKWVSSVYPPEPVFNTILANHSEVGDVPTEMTWTISTLPTDWVVSNQYVKVESVDYTYESSWGLRIYTNNTSIYAGGSNPAGLIKEEEDALPTLEKPLPMAWLVSSEKYLLEDLTIFENFLIDSEDIYLSTGTNSEFYPWHWFLDHLDNPDTEENSSTVNIFDSDKGFHFASGGQDYQIYAIEETDNDVFADTFYLYIAGDFTNADSSSTYKTELVLERYID
ncbi:MAG: hypothetical protein GY817_05885 [bacterium]|nr:hypothetical protein [bacterium]